MSVSVMNDSCQSITLVCPDAGQGDYFETLVPDPNIENENYISQPLNPFPKKVKMTTTTANNCREMLQEFSSLTYLITDIPLLHDLEDKLRQTVTQVKGHIETSSSGIGREHETKTVGRYKPRKKQGNKRGEMKPFPKRAYLNKYTHGVGKVAGCKRSRPVNIAVMSQAHQILLKAKKQSFLNLPSKRSTESGYSKITPDYSRILDPNYCLFEDDIDPCLKLISKQWLDVVTQACHLIRWPKRFDAVVQYGTERYAQVLHMSEKHHWVSAMNIGASYGTVKYIVSLNLASQLKTHPGKELALAVESVQAQNGSTDCGLFAVMYLVKTLFGTNLSKTAFDWQTLSVHMLWPASSRVNGHSSLDYNCHPRSDGPGPTPSVTSYSAHAEGLMTTPIWMRLVKRWYCVAVATNGFMVGASLSNLQI
ncbi:uncharacterized protein [Watersipora subatra]|uniref:uncharacterized protein n=1 Tax=Watersipora subatra TaxID=2589382 RepID=UPI00355BC008